MDSVTLRICHANRASADWYAFTCCPGKALTYLYCTSNDTDFGRSSEDWIDTWCCGLPPWVSRAVPMSSDPGAFLMCMARNEYEPRKRQKDVGRHSGAIS